MEENQRLKTANSVARFVRTGQLVRGEVVENFVGVIDALLLLKVALDKALHGGGAVGTGLVAEDLLVDGWKVVIGVGVELALVFGERLDGCGSVGRVGVGLVAGKTVDVGVDRVERSEHVVERAVLHHEDDDVLELLDTGFGLIWRHWNCPWGKDSIMHP